MDILMRRNQPHGITWIRWSQHVQRNLVENRLIVQALQNKPIVTFQIVFSNLALLTELESY